MNRIDLLNAFLSFGEYLHRTSAELKDVLNCVRALYYIAPDNSRQRIEPLKEKFDAKYCINKNWEAAKLTSQKPDCVVSTLENMVICADFQVEDLKTIIDECGRIFISNDPKAKAKAKALLARLNNAKASRISIDAQGEIDTSETETEEESIRYVPLGRIMRRLVRATGYGEGTVHKKVIKLNCYRLRDGRYPEVRADKVDDIIAYLIEEKRTGKRNSGRYGFSRIYANPR